jgi:hypothetical protein
MKCWNSAFNARGSRLITVVVRLGAVKIYVAAVAAFRKKERQMKLSYHQNWWFSEFHPPLNADVVLFWSFFLNLSLCMAKLRVLMLCFSYFTDNSIILGCFKTNKKNLSFLSPCLTDTNITKIFVLSSNIDPTLRHCTSWAKFGWEGGRKVGEEVQCRSILWSPNSVRQKSVREGGTVCGFFF